MANANEERSLSELELEAETWKLEQLAIDIELDLQSRLASRWEARVYYFDGPVNFKSVADCISTLDDWRRLDRNRDVKRMHIIFNGHARMMQACALHDYIRWIEMDGFEVTFEIAGRASGQAALIQAAAKHRSMTHASWLNLEEIPFDLAGNTHLADNEIEWNDRLEAQQRRILAERSTVSTRQIAGRLRLKGWNLDGNAALAAGFIDEVTTARPEILTRVVGARFGALPQATSMKERLTIATIRKMRAESVLFGLRNRDRECNALNNGVVRFIDTVTSESVNKAKCDLDAALRLSTSDISLLIDSNGGSCTDGLGFINLCEQIRTSPRVINTECIGYAASMGGVMLQCGKKRTMGKNSWLLIHRVSSWWGDTTSQAKLGKAYSDALQRQCFEILASRSVFTADEILERCRDKDWWLTAEEALKYGFIDEIR